MRQGDPQQYGRHVGGACRWWAPVEVGFVGVGNEHLGAGQRPVAGDQREVCCAVLELLPRRCGGGGRRPVRRGRHPGSAATVLLAPPISGESVMVTSGCRYDCVTYR